MTTAQGSPAWSYLNAVPAFWDTYELRARGHRRQALEALFRAYPGCRLPVNNKWQASTKDRDLSRLLKLGVLKRIREGGRRQHPMNRSSNKRQTYLVLA